MNEETPLDITFVSVPIDQPPKNMDFGKWPVCDKCGKDMSSSPDNIKTDCECGGKVTTLKNYTETILKQEFDNDKWRFETKEFSNE